jgi:hypothetical protein
LSRAVVAPLGSNGPCSHNAALPVRIDPAGKQLVFSVVETRAFRCQRPTTSFAIAGSNSALL